MRIIDNNGYEYRTNSVNPFTVFGWGGPDDNITFNYNTKGNTTLSDVVGIPFFLDEDEIAAALAEEDRLADQNEEVASFDSNDYERSDSFDNVDDDMDDEDFDNSQKRTSKGLRKKSAAKGKAPKKKMKKAVLAPAKKAMKAKHKPSKEAL